MIANITENLFADTPRDTLYHYTSLSGLLGIVGSGELRASDIRYMNDSTELRHTLDLLRSQIRRRLAAGTDRPQLLSQFMEWLSPRVVRGPMLFGGSFRANGNLLSQWRGYSVHGKGVSLGFAPQHIIKCASQQNFQLTKCLYSPRAQRSLVEKILDTIEDSVSVEQEEEKQYGEKFARIEADLLRIAAIMKHPSFEEEQEWRIVSPVISETRHHPIEFREGHSMLVPFYRFSLRSDSGTGIGLDHVYAGPTNNIELSMRSLELYLVQQGSSPRLGIAYCDIPYRQR